MNGAQQSLNWRFRVAAWLLLAQGILMEIGAALALLVLLVLKVPQTEVGTYFRFSLPYLQDNLYLMMVMSGIFGVLRIVGAVALLRDRVWGLALCILMCAVTLVLMIFLLPAGVADGVLSGAALVLIMTRGTIICPRFSHPRGAVPERAS